MQLRIKPNQIIILAYEVSYYMLVLEVGGGWGVGGHQCHFTFQQKISKWLQYGFIHKEIIAENNN